MHCATRFPVAESWPVDLIDPVLDSSTTVYHPYLPSKTHLSLSVYSHLSILLLDEFSILDLLSTAGRQQKILLKYQTPQS